MAHLTVSCMYTPTNRPGLYSDQKPKWPPLESEAVAGAMRPLAAAPPFTYIISYMDVVEMWTQSHCTVDYVSFIGQPLIFKVWNLFMSNKMTM